MNGRSSAAMAAREWIRIGVPGFTATFVVISLACDDRHVYGLDRAAITGVPYVVIDPSLRREKACAASSAARTSA